MGSNAKVLVGMESFGAPENNDTDTDRDIVPAPNQDQEMDLPFASRAKQENNDDIHQQNPSPTQSGSLSTLISTSNTQIPSEHSHTLHHED